MVRVRGHIVLRWALAVAGCAVCGVGGGVGQVGSQRLEVPLVGFSSTVGRVVFRETMTGKLNIDVTVEALTPGEHAVHLHENGVCEAPDFRSAGPHFNPEGREHGWRNPNGHHAGDLPENIVVDAAGNGHLNVTVADLDLTPGSAHSVLGRSIVVHERADDMRSDPGGDAGNRIACGVIPAEGVGRRASR